MVALAFRVRQELFFGQRGAYKGRRRGTYEESFLVGENLACRMVGVELLQGTEGKAAS
jgi:hypothetical protein